MNRIRNIGRNLIMSFVIISLAGCSLPTAPSNLIRPPHINEANIKLKQIIENLLPADARLTIPASQKGNSKAFFEVDVNGDGVKEIIAFYKLGNEGFRLGFMVLTPDSNDSWLKIGQVDEYAEDIAYVDFIDITGNKVPELLIGWSGGGNGLSNQLAIFSFNKDKLVELEPISYYTLTTGDLDGDGLVEIAISKDKRVQDMPNVVVEVYKYKDQKLNLTYTTEFEGCYPGELIIGNANTKSPGLFVETYLGAHSAATHLLVYQEGQLVNVLNSEINDISYDFKPYPLPSKDANGDGIIEIGVHLEPPGAENLAMVEIPWVENWYQWDGESGLNWVEETYANYGLGYEWQIPTQWRNKYTLTSDNGEEINQVEFYSLIGNQKHKIFTLLTIDKEIWAQAEQRIKQEGQTYQILGENKPLNKKYVAILPELKAKQDLMSITIEQIKERFKIVSFRY